MENENIGKCGFLAMFKGQEFEIWQSENEGLFAAKKKAIAHFKPKKKDEWLISVHLCVRENGSEVLQSTCF